MTKKPKPSDALKLIAKMSSDEVTELIDDLERSLVASRSASDRDSLRLILKAARTRLIFLRTDLVALRDELIAKLPDSLKKRPRGL